jgi:hypothetical protein
MFKRAALISVVVALALSPVVALAQTGSSYGSQGSYGAPGSPTPFDRSQNNFNESKERARAGSAWIRNHSAVNHPRHPNAQ